MITKFEQYINETVKTYSQKFLNMTAKELFKEILFAIGDTRITDSFSQEYYTDNIKYISQNDDFTFIKISRNQRAIDEYPDALHPVYWLSIYNIFVELYPDDLKKHKQFDELWDDIIFLKVGNHANIRELLNKYNDKEINELVMKYLWNFKRSSIPRKNFEPYMYFIRSNKSGLWNYKNK